MIINSLCLFKKSGHLNITQKTFRLNLIKAIMVKKSWLKKIFLMKEKAHHDKINNKKLNENIDIKEDINDL